MRIEAAIGKTVRKISMEWIDGRCTILFEDGSRMTIFTREEVHYTKDAK